MSYLLFTKSSFAQSLCHHLIGRHVDVELLCHLHDIIDKSVNLRRASRLHISLHGCRGISRLILQNIQIDFDIISLERIPHLVGQRHDFPDHRLEHRSRFARPLKSIRAHIVIDACRTDRGNIGKLLQTISLDILGKMRLYARIVQVVGNLAKLRSSLTFPGTEIDAQDFAVLQDPSGVLYLC